jgi:hypothetical protein
LFFNIASGYCKEVFSDTCHKNKEAWYEYFPAKNVNGAGKCKKMKCGKKGPKPVKKSKNKNKTKYKQIKQQQNKKNKIKTPRLHPSPPHRSTGKLRKQEMW